jgi:hypothetical protein
MAWVSKIWYDAPNPLTPLSAAAMNDLEARIGAAATQSDAFNLQPAVRVANSAAQTITSGAGVTTLGFDTNRFDSDSQHYTSAAALTGTLAKTSGSAAVVGTGTLFTSQLSVGQVFDLPGTATERRVVTSITDDTHLTVSGNYANTASGQTGTRVNSAIVARTAGVYSIFTTVNFAANTTGRRQAQMSINGATATPIADMTIQAVTDAAAPTRLVVGAVSYKLAQWDYVEVQVSQVSGGNLDVLLSANRSPEFGMFRVAAG